MLEGRKASRRELHVAFPSVSSIRNSLDTACDVKSLAVYSSGSEYSLFI